MNQCRGASGQGGQTHHQGRTGDDDLTGDDSQVSRLVFARTLEQGRQSSRCGSVLRVSREFAPASVRLVPCRPRSDTITGLRLHCFPRPATPDASRNRAPSVTFVVYRLDPLTSLARHFGFVGSSVAFCGSVVWLGGTVARYTNNISIPRFSTILEPFPPSFQPFEVSVTTLR